MKKTIPEEHKKRLNDLGCYLRENRFSEGLTIIDVADDLNLHKNTIARAEHGYNMRLTSIFILADYYQIPIHEFFADIK